MNNRIEDKNNPGSIIGKYRKIILGIVIAFLLFTVIATIMTPMSAGFNPDIIPPLPTSGTPTVLETNTPQPTATMSADEIGAKVIELLNSNGGCEFPCIWGIQPGITTWEEAEDILLPVSRRIENQPDLPGNEISLKKVFIADLPEEYLKKFLPDNRLWEFPYPQINFLIRDETIDVIWADMVAYDYLMKSILENYGMPDEIYAHTFNRVLYDRFLNLYMYYRGIGIVAEFYSPGVIGEGGIHGCFDIGSIVTWNPTEELSFQETASSIYVDDLEWFAILPYEEATGESIEMFYERVLSSYEDVCITTPKELWLNQDGP